MKANFFCRLGAYFIDLIIIGLITLVVTGYIPVSETYNELINEKNELLEKYNDGEIEYVEYFKEYNDINYLMTKDNYLTDSIGIVIGLAYFILLTYFNNGRTIGKLITHCHVVSREGKLSIVTAILRSLLVTSYFTTIINLILIMFLNKEMYMSCSTMIESLGGIFVVTNAVMVLYRKDRCGLHDLILKTEVVKEEV